MGTKGDMGTSGRCGGIWGLGGDVGDMGTRRRCGEIWGPQGVTQ